MLTEFDNYIGVFDALAQEKVRLVKMCLIEIALKHETFRKLVYYALNPFLSYGIRTYELEPDSGYSTDMDLFTFFDKLSRREIKGKAARLMAGEYARLSIGLERAITIVLEKDLGCGIGVKTINEISPGFIPTFEVMKAEDYDPTRMVFPCYYSLKIDGVRCLSIVKSDTDIKFLSLNGRPIPNADYLAPKLAAIYLEFQQPFVFDGDIDFGCGFDNTKSELYREKWSGKEGGYFIFDCIPLDIFFAQGHTASLYDRYGTLSYLLKKTPNDGVLNLVEHKIAHTRQQLLEALKEVLDLGKEGLVAKDPEGKYLFKRSWLWQKLKKFYPVDLTVIKVIEGKNKNKGKLGAFLCDYKGHKVKVGSGISDEDRVKYWEHPPEVIEVAYFEITPNGSLRDPRFIRVREDKT